MADRDRGNDRNRDWDADRETAWHGADRYRPNKPDQERQRRDYRADDDNRRYGAGDYEQSQGGRDDYGRSGPAPRREYEEDYRSDRQGAWPSYQPGRDSPAAHDRSGYGWRGEAGPSGRSDEWRGARDSRGEDRNFWNRTKDELASWFGDRSAEQRRRADGEHRGRGPKGYRRADDRIHDDVNDRLTDDSWLDASDVEVKVERAEVILTGRVRTREDKRRAEAIAEQVSGVAHVQNNLRVDDFQAEPAYSAIPPAYPF
jgi:osmotically-inducible protein OsmY